MTLIATTCALTVLAGFTVIAGAQSSNPTELTRLTFNTSVELPGVTLPPGTYEFQLADSPQRNVVQVYRAGDRQIMGQWTFVQAQRPRVSEETVVMFRESEGGATPAIQYWYYPGERIGKEFIYPKEQAQLIAARTGQTVRSESGPISSSETARADAPTPVVAGAVTDAADETRVAVRRGAEQVGEFARNDALRPLGTNDEQVGEPVRPVAASSGRQDTNASRTGRISELPQTASLLPLSGVIGLIALAAATGVRYYSR
jgi:hypothetical protein